MPGLRIAASRVVTGLLTATGAGFAVNAWLLHQTRGRLHQRPEDIGHREVAIVPGARVYRDNTPSAVLADRLACAAALLEEGRVDRILVSGDARAPEADETAAMVAWLQAHGVPADRIQADPGGIRTQATMQRARRLHQVRRAVVCTQSFHLARAVFLARRAGIDVVGLAADRRVYRKRHKDRLREFFARQVAFIDSCILPPRRPD